MLIFQRDTTKNDFAQARPQETFLGGIGHQNVNLIRGRPSLSIIFLFTHLPLGMRDRSAYSGSSLSSPPLKSISVLGSR